MELERQEREKRIEEAKLAQEAAEADRQRQLELYRLEREKEAE